MRTLTKLATLAAAATLAVTMSACSSSTPTAVHSPDKAAATSAPEPTKAPEVGHSLAAPAPAGKSFAGAGFDLTPGPVTWDATAAIAAVNMFNEPPTAGMQYLTVDLTVKNTGTEPVEPGVQGLALSFMTPDGQTFAPSLMVMTAHPLTSAPEVPAGGSVTGTVVYEVPAGTASGVFTANGLFIAAA